MDAEAAAQSALHTIAGAIDLISPFVSPIQSPQRGLSFRGTMPMPGPHDASPPDLARAARLYQQEAAAAAARQHYYYQQQQQQYLLDPQYHLLAAEAGAGEQARPSGELDAEPGRRAVQVAGWPTGSPPDSQPTPGGHAWDLLSGRGQEPGPGAGGPGGGAAYQHYDRAPPGYDPYAAAPAPAPPQQQSMFAPPLDPEQARLYQQLVTQGIGVTLGAGGRQQGAGDAEPTAVEAVRAGYYAVAQQLQYQDPGWGPRPAEQEPSARRASSTPP